MFELLSLENSSKRIIFPSLSQKQTVSLSYDSDIFLYPAANINFNF